MPVADTSLSSSFTRLLYRCYARSLSAAWLAHWPPWEWSPSVSKKCISTEGKW